jgi:hypothetical protein
MNAKPYPLRAYLEDAATLVCLISCWAIVVLLAVAVGP